MGHGTCTALASSQCRAEPTQFPEEGGYALETTTLTMIRTSTCPECGAEIRLVGRLLIGEIFGCGQCSAPLEVASTDPAVLEPIARIDDGEERAD